MYIKVNYGQLERSYHENKIFEEGCFSSMYFCRFFLLLFQLLAQLEMTWFILAV